jgi:prepilin-type N-terminal cleavage/methylation domain-containing protein
MKRKTNRQSGFTLVELLISFLMVSIIAASAFNFYGKMHNSTLTQEDISDMQLTSRNTLDEISKTLRNAGFKIYTGTGYKIVGDSLIVYYQGANPSDTTTFYLTEFTSTDYGNVAGRTPDMHYYKLMHQLNSNAPVEFATNIKSLTYNVINAKTIDIMLTIYAGRIDDDYSMNGGFRTLSTTERVVMANL